MVPHIHNLPAGTWWRANHYPYLPLCSWFSFTWQLTTVFRQLHDHSSITKAVSRLFLSIAISKQLNAASYLLYKPWPLLWKKTTRDFTWALVSLPVQWLWSLVWEWDYCVHAYIIRNWHPTQRQQPGRAVNNFYQPGWICSYVWRQSGCAVISISFVIKWWWVLKPISRYCLTRWSQQRKKGEKWHFRYCTLMHLAVICMGFWALILIIKVPKSKAGCLNKLLAYLWWSYFTCPPHPYIESQSTDSLVKKYVHNSRQSNSQKQQTTHKHLQSVQLVAAIMFRGLTVNELPQPVSKSTTITTVWRGLLLHHLCALN